MITQIKKKWLIYFGITIIVIITSFILLKDPNNRFSYDPEGDYHLGEKIGYFGRENEEFFAGTYGPNGKTVVTSSRNPDNVEKVRVWNLHTGEKLAQFNDVLAINLAYSPNGERIATVSGGQLQVWDITTQKEVAEFGSEVHDVAYDPQGETILTGGYNNLAQIWDSQTGEQLMTLEHGASVWSVAYSPTGKQLVTGGGDGIARVWNAKTGKEIMRLEHNTKGKLGENQIRSIAYGPKGETILTNIFSLGSRGSAKLWDADTGEELAIFPGGGRAVAYGPQEKKFLTSSSSISMWNLTTKEKLTFSYKNGFDVAFGPQGKTILILDKYDGARLLWAQSNIKRMKEIARFQHEEKVNHIAYSPEGERVLSASDDKTARIWDLETEQEVARFQHNKKVGNAIYSPNGTTILTTTNDEIAHVWDINKGEDIARFQHEKTMNSLAYSPDGKKVLTASDDKTARVWNIETEQEIAHFQHENKVSKAIYSPDGTTVLTLDDITAERGGIQKARLWKVSTGEQMAYFQHLGEYSQQKEVYSIAYSPDGKKVLTGGYGTALVWDISTGEEIACFDPYLSDSLHDAAYGPEGKTVLTADSGRIYVWNLDTEQKLAKLEHWQTADIIAYDQKGETVFVSDDLRLEDNSITSRVWDIKTGKEVARLYHELKDNHGSRESKITDAAYAPNGETVLTGDVDGVVRLWKVNTKETIMP